MLRKASSGTSRSLASPKLLRPMTSGVKSLIRMERPCSVSTSGGAHDHPSLVSPDHATPGNGLLLFFRVDDFPKALERARTLVPKLEEEPQLNPNTQTMEFSLQDPDGYHVTISSLS